MDQTDSRPQPRRTLQDLLSPAIVAGVVLGVCLGSTWWLWRNASADAAQDIQADFDFRVRELVNSIAQRMQTYEQVLYGVQGLYISSDYVDREEFHRYLAGQHLNQHFPGIQGVGYMRLVGGAQREVHTLAVRRDGFPDYTVRPPGDRPQYAPIIYIEPFSGSNLKAFGYDPLSEPVRRAALERARDSGLPAMSGKIRLVQEDQREGEEQAGFLLVLPVYHNAQPQHTIEQRRAALTGWVYAPFRLGDVMAGLGGERAAKLDVEIYDGEQLGAAGRMYDSRPGPPQPGMRHTMQKISLAGHRWTVRISGVPGSGVGAERDSKVQLIGGAGVVLSGVLAALAWMLARSSLKARRALSRARQLAAELKEGQDSLLAMAESAQRSQAVLRSILDSTVDGILVDNFDGGVLNSNRRFRELWNVPEHLDWQQDGAILLQQVAEQLAQPSVFLAAVARRQGENEVQHELLYLRDGRVIELFTRGLKLGSAPARLWSFRDITERTQSERREQTRRQVLELLATGAPLQTILDSVVRGVEDGHPELRCAILLLDEDGRRLHVRAAPSLPAFLCAAIDGQPVDQPGTCGQAVQLGRRVIAADIAHDELWSQYRDLARQAGVQACWSEPIRAASGAVLGTFAIFHRAAQAPGVAQLALMEQASRLAGIAIEQAQAAVALRAGEARFRSLYDHAPVALWEQDWSAVRAALAELEQSGVDDVPAWLRANPSQVARLAGLVRIIDVNAAALAQVGAPPGSKDATALTLAQNFDASAMPAFAQALGALAQGAHLFACESSFERLDGVQRQNELTLLVMPGHTHSLDFVIVSTVDITERKRMNDELLVLATTDFLTGLPNRREFMARLDDEQARLQRDVGEQGAVLMLDLDHFKRVNDEYGHATGDAVLRHLAALMRDSQRKIDTLGRVGGEEFAVLLPGADMAAATAFAERLRQRIAGTPVEVEGRTLSVTVSIGIAPLDPADASGDAALVRADKALYCAKRGGRNRVEQVAQCGPAEEKKRPEDPPPAV